MTMKKQGIGLNSSVQRGLIRNDKLLYVHKFLVQISFELVLLTMLIILNHNSRGGIWPELTMCSRIELLICLHSHSESH